MGNIVRVAALVLLAACGSGGDAAGPSGPSPQPLAARPSSTAELTVVEPQPGATVGSDVRVLVELRGARLVKEVSSDLAPDEGHIHLKLDGETITLLGGLDEVISDVRPGPHLLEVEFVAADHGPFNPRVVETISFVVE